MGMKYTQIRVDGYYQNVTGQIRHILKITGDMAVYEVVDRGRLNPNNSATPEVGTTRTVGVGSIAGWATKEVPAPDQHERAS